MKTSLRVILAMVALSGAFAAPQANAAAPCARIADHVDDVTNPNGDLYTDQRVGGRLDFVEVGFARLGGNDLAIDITVDDFTEGRILFPRALYSIAWDWGDLDITDDNGSWSFVARRTGDVITSAASIAEPTALETHGIVDEASNHIGVVVADTLRDTDMLSFVTIVSAEINDLGQPSNGDDVPEKTHFTAIDLAASCVTPAAPLRATCRELADGAGDVGNETYAGTGGSRIDMTRVSFLPDGTDLAVDVEVVDIDGPRALGANASSFSIDATVDTKDLSIDVFESDDSWSATATLDDVATSVSISSSTQDNVFEVAISSVLGTSLPRYLVPQLLSFEGVGTMSPIGPVFAGGFGPADTAWANPTDSAAYFTAVDLDAPCPWPGN